MADTFNLKIIVPGGIIFEDAGVIRLHAAGEEGELEVLPGHTDFLTPLRISRLEVIKQGYKRRERSQWSIAGGILQVSKAGVVVISTAVEQSDSIDLERARNARRRARERLKKPEAEIDIDRARQALARAEVRLRVASFNRDNSEG